MRKRLGIFLAVVMASSLLFGCGSASNETENAAPAAEPTAQEEGAAAPAEKEAEPGGEAAASDLKIGFSELDIDSAWRICPLPRLQRSLISAQPICPPCFGSTAVRILRIISMPFESKKRAGFWRRGPVRYPISRRRWGIPTPRIFVKSLKN